ncbi:response regulator [Iodidimonas sp. SYSU 1G8]|uniref:response regulator n=1 Tax=Iodidimonas sp. SYSU 1G8 TaxID=3133967 RepID=UPI0031FF25DD
MDTDRGTSAMPMSILLVDDDNSLLTTISTYLRLKGHSVFEAETGAKAVEVLEAGTEIDFVLSDIEMPGGVDGVGLAHWITAHRPGLPIVLTTGRPLDMRAIDGLEVLLKPYRLAEVLAMMSTMLAPTRPC